MKRTAIPPIESPRLKIPEMVRIGGVNYTVVQSAKIIDDEGRLAESDQWHDWSPAWMIIPLAFIPTRRL